MSDKKNGMALNVFFSFGAQIITYIIPFVLSPYLSRVLLPEGIGEYSYVYSIAYYFGIVIIFGFSNYGTRQIAANKDNKVLYSSYFLMICIIRFCFFLLSTTAYLIFINFNPFSNSIDIKIYYALVLLLFGDAIDITFLYQGLEEFKLISIVNFLVNILYMCSVFVFIKTVEDLFIYSILKSSIKLLISIILLFFVIKKIVKPDFKLIEKKSILKESLLFFLPTLVMTIGPSIDQTMIGLMTNNAEVGYYQQVQKLVLLIGSFTYALGPIMLSRISVLYSKDNTNRIDKDIKTLMNFSWLVIIPSIIGLYSIGMYFIPLYYGDEFIPAINVLYFFLPEILFSSTASLVINGYYYPSKKVGLATIILASTVLFNVATNFFAIKYFGASGAATTSSMAGLLLVFLLILFSWKKLNYKLIFSGLWKVVLSGLTMGGVLFLLNYTIWPLLNVHNFGLVCGLDIIIGIIVYFTMCFILKEYIFSHIINMIFRRKRKEENNISS